jgi:hypothetical protein
MFENRVLGKTFVPKRDEVTGKWRRLHNEKPYGLHSSRNTTRVTESRTVSWAGHVACMGEQRGAYRVLIGIPDGKRPFGRPAADGKIILKWMFKNWNEGMDWIHLAQYRDR